MVAMNFKLEIQNLKDGAAVIEIEGEIDVYTAPRLKQEIINLIDSGNDRITIDLTSVEYVDSTALGVLISGHKRLREHEGRLTILCPNPRIRRIFEITGLDSIFNMACTESGTANIPQSEGGT